MKKLTYSKKLFLILFSFVLMFLFDCFLGIFITKDRFSQITDALEPHTKRIWRNRANYKANFFGEEIDTNNLGLRDKRKLPKEIDVLVLGASPSFGWGVKQEFTYASLLEKELLKNNKNAKVLNGSMIGYSSFQGSLLLEELLEIYKPRFVTLSYVINDVDMFRFMENNYLEDKEVGSKNLISVLLLKFLRQFNSIKIMSNVFATVQKKLEPMRPRVSLADYQNNLDKMVNMIRAAGATPVLVKFPVNITKTFSAGKESRELLKNFSCRLLDDQSLKEWLHLYKCLKFKANPHELSLIENEIKKLSATISSRNSLLYNDALENLAKIQNVILVDIASAFEKEKQYLFLDPIEDTIHPNMVGHRTMAREIYRKIYGQ